jgi:hypothetical protein
MHESPICHVTLVTPPPLRRLVGAAPGIALSATVTCEGGHGQRAVYFVFMSQLHTQRKVDMIKTRILAVVGSLALGSLAFAGYTNHREVTLSLTGLWAYGNIRDTRVSADSVQYLSCATVFQAGNPPYGYCDARDATSQRLYCVTKDPATIGAMAGVSDNSQVFFSCDAPNGHMTGFSLTQSSTVVQ